MQGNGCVWKDALCQTLILHKTQQTSDEMQVVQIEFTVNGVNEYNFASVSGPITEALENELDEPMNVILQQHEQHGKTTDRQIIAEIEVDPADASATVDELNEISPDLVAGIQEALAEEEISGVTISNNVRVSLVLEDREPSAMSSIPRMMHLVGVSFMITGISPNNFHHVEGSIIAGMNAELGLERSQYKVLAFMAGFYHSVRVFMKMDTRTAADELAAEISELSQDILNEIKAIFEEEAEEIQVHRMMGPQVGSRYVNHAEGRHYLRQQHSQPRDDPELNFAMIFMVVFLSLTTMCLSLVFYRCYRKTHDDVQELSLDLILDEVDPERTLTTQQRNLYSMRV